MTSLRVQQILADPTLVATGWMLLIVLWHSTVMAMLLALWGSRRAGARPQQEYRAACIALSAVVELAALTPVLSSSLGGDAIRPLLSESRLTSVGLYQPDMAAGAPAAELRLVFLGTPRLITTDSVAAVGAIVWMAGVAILGLRLAGGWWLALRLRRRAQALADRSIKGLVRSASEKARLAVPVELLQSDGVEAPVVIGWRRPAVILPVDAMRRLTPQMLDAVVAHEIAHIRRGDYAANAVQAVVEVVLFFCPGVHWISTRIRETREFCCDDVAVEACADAAQFVGALTMMASLGARNPVKPAMGAVGPRLIIRVRRLLEPQRRPPYARARAVALGTLLIVFAGAGVPVTLIAVGRSAIATPAGPLVPAPQATSPVPYGYAPEQDGSGVALRIVSTADPSGFMATVKNLTREPIVALQFAAAAQPRGAAAHGPVRVVRSGVLPASLGSEDQVDLTPFASMVAQLQQAMADDGASRIQLFFGLSYVRYANGWEWRRVPNAQALSGADAINPSWPEIPRAFIERDADMPPASDRLCRGTGDKTFSPGAIVPIRREPGRSARCDDGRWVEYHRSR